MRRSQRSANRSGGIQRSYELFGFDLMLDSELRPWLCEVNKCPTLEHSTPVTTDLCTRVVWLCLFADAVCLKLYESMYVLCLYVVILLELVQFMCVSVSPFICAYIVAAAYQVADTCALMADHVMAGLTPNSVGEWDRLDCDGV